MYGNGIYSYTKSYHRNRNSDWKCSIQIMNEWWMWLWWIVELSSQFSFHSSIKQIWYSSIYWFIKVWWILKMVFFLKHWKVMVMDRIESMVNLKWILNGMMNLNMVWWSYRIHFTWMMGIHFVVEYYVYYRNEWIM